MSKRLTLTPDQVAKRNDLEQVVNVHLASFLKCAAALRAIRDEKLFEGHANFDAYCYSTGKISSRRAIDKLRRELRGNAMLGALDFLKPFQECPIPQEKF